MSYRPLEPISSDERWSDQGKLTDFAYRWLNKLRAQFLRHDVLTASLTPNSVATVTVAEEAFTVTGAVVGAAVSVSGPAITAGVGPISARVSAADTITIAFVNPTGGALTPAAGTYIFHHVRP